MLKANQAYEFTYKSISYIGVGRKGSFPDQERISFPDRQANWIFFSDNHTESHPLIAAVRRHADSEHKMHGAIFPAGHGWSKLARILKDIGVTYTALPTMVVAGRSVWINTKTNIVYLDSVDIRSQAIIEFINSGTIPIGHYVGIYRINTPISTSGVQIGCTHIDQVKLNSIRKFLKKYYKLPMKKVVKVKESYLNIKPN